MKKAEIKNTDIHQTIIVCESIDDVFSETLKPGYSYYFKIESQDEDDMEYNHDERVDNAIKRYLKSKELFQYSDLAYRLYCKVMEDGKAELIPEIENLHSRIEKILQSYINL